MLLPTLSITYLSTTRFKTTLFAFLGFFNLMPALRPVFKFLFDFLRHMVQSDACTILSMRICLNFMPYKSSKVTISCIFYISKLIIIYCVVQEISPSFAFYLFMFKNVLQQSCKKFRPFPTFGSQFFYFILIGKQP